MSTPRQRELLALFEKHQKVSTIRDACTCGDEGHEGLMESGEATVNHWRHLASIIAPAEPKDDSPMVMRSVRVPEKLWDAAKIKADERGESLSDAIRKLLERYAR